MKYGALKLFDIANGSGVRVSLFVSGCRHHCKECFNQDSWSFDYGQKFTDDTMNEILDNLSLDFVEGLSILGGEPLEPENQQTVLEIINTVKDKFPEKDIWMWTGFVYEKLLMPDSRACTDQLIYILNNIDILVDGPFVLEKKDWALKFRGSLNQRIIDMKKTIENNYNIVLWEDKLPGRVNG